MKVHKVFQKEIRQIAAIPNRYMRDMVALLWAENNFETEIDNTLRYRFSIESLEQLIAWTKTIQPPLHWSETPTFPLGKYAEQLLVLYFQHHPNYELLGHNIQLIEGKQTHGEVDFLLWDQLQKQKLHLEFALKYYLKVEKEGKICFLGPNTKDSLQTKVDKLTNKQSQLLIKHSALLNEELKATEFTPKIVLKGLCFYPFEEWKKRNRHLHTEAWWLHADDVQKLKNDPNSYYLIKNKKDWIFPFSDNQEIMKHQQMEKEAGKLLANERNAIMLVRLNEKKEVIDRGFLMRTAWPD